MDSKENKKELILKAAGSAFARYGFSKTTMDDIGELVGMKKNSLYHYFVNKEDIFCGIIEMDAEEYFSTLKAELAEEKSASGKLRKYVQITSDFWSEKVNSYQLVTSMQAEIVERIAGLYESSIRRQKIIIREILEEGVSNDEFIEHDSQQLSEDLIDMSSSIEHWEYHRQRMSHFDENYFNENKRKKLNLLNFIIKGLRQPKK